MTATLLARSAGIRSRTPDGGTVLHTFAEFNTSPAVGTLLPAKGATLDAYSNRGQTLFQAVHQKPPRRGRGSCPTASRPLTDKAENACHKRRAQPLLPLRGQPGLATPPASGNRYDAAATTGGHPAMNERRISQPAEAVALAERHDAYDGHTAFRYNLNPYPETNNPHQSIRPKPCHRGTRPGCCRRLPS